MDRKEYSKRYYEMHKEERRLYLETNRERIKKQRKAYREKSKYKKWLYRQRPEQRFADYNYRAKSKGIDFNLTLDNFIHLTSQPCFYCNQLPEIGFVGIDRIDSTGGYSQENCLPCCSMCNYMKKDYTKSDFIKHIYQIADNMRRRCIL